MVRTEIDAITDLNEAGGEMKAACTCRLRA